MQKNIQKTSRRIFFLLLGLACVCPYGFSGDDRRYDITCFGAKGDSLTDNTGFINKAIETCAYEGGGTVRVPEGVFLTGTLFLKSGVHLYLEEGAVICGVSRLDAYASLSSDKAAPYYRVKSVRWNRALIIGEKVSRIAITGKGKIDGGHLEDEKGEEGLRGPHVIGLSRSSDIEISGITIRRASNYACMGYDLERAEFKSLTIEEGWDGIHIRGGKNIRISECRFHTGDDAIAGGLWEHLSVRNCDLNSSCNGIRVIMPVREVEVEGCRFEGPGKYPHRTSGKRQRANMLSGIIVQPGAWFSAPGKVENISIRNCSFDRLDNPFLFTLNRGNEGKGIVLKNLKGHRLLRAAASIESWEEASWQDIELSDISLEYQENKETSPRNADRSEEPLRRPSTDYRPLPCWGLYLRNVENADLQNIRLLSTPPEDRPALYMEKVNRIRMKQVGTEKIGKIENKLNSK